MIVLIDYLNKPMNFVDFEKLKKKIQGRSVPKPISGTLSGHAAGEPFDKLVFKEIKKQLPKHTFRQYEYLNDLYSKNPKVIGYEARQALFDSPSVMFLLSRGKNAIEKWSTENLFDEKQNDTTDIIVAKDNCYEIIDVKTRNISKSAQPPNIISAYKLAQVCARMIDNNEFDRFSIKYFEIDWVLEGNKLVCHDSHSANLFMSEPDNLYINWAAALQVQFHIRDLDQSFLGDWAFQFIKHFVTQARKRANDMIRIFVRPFEKYLK